MRTILILFAFVFQSFLAFPQDSIKPIAHKNSLSIIAGLSSYGIQNGIYTKYNDNDKSGSGHYNSNFTFQNGESYSDNVKQNQSPIIGLRLNIQKTKVFGISLGAFYTIFKYNYRYTSSLGTNFSSTPFPLTYKRIKNDGTATITCHYIGADIFVNLTLPLKTKIYFGNSLYNNFSQQYQSEINHTEETVLTKVGSSGDSISSLTNSSVIHDFKPSKTITSHFLVRWTIGIEKSFLIRKQEFLIGASYFQSQGPLTFKASFKGLQLYIGTYFFFRKHS